jgi:hypothetical protein
LVQKELLLCKESISMPHVINKTKCFAALLCILVAATAFGQRSIGAARFIIDDRTTAVRTVTLEATSPMTSAAYTLKFPAAAPGTAGYKNVIAYDNSGNATWISGFAVVTNATLAGDGTSADPLRINLANANTWTALQTFNGGLTAAGSTTNLNSTNTNVNGSNFTTSAGTTSTFNGPVVFNGTVSQPLTQNNIFVGNASNRAAQLAPVANRFLATDGAGNVAWSSTFPGTIPFSQITSGNNVGQNLQIGAGTTIDLNGGTVESNAFQGTGSLTNAVDLTTAEVNGILPAGSGGTGVTTLDQDEVLLGNGASGIASLDNPVGNAILTQDGVGAPSWSTSIPGGITVPFSQISTGSNTTATMTVSPGASIIAGGGTVEATRYFGTGSATNQVDLNTAEVAGTLTGNKGGTGVSSVDLNEVVLGNGASGITSINNPGTVQILTHPGGAAVAPTWSSSIPSPITISVSQLTTGTLQPGVTFNVGAGSTIVPTGGTNTANNVVGAGPNKFSGSVAIPMGTVNQSIPFTGLVAGASVVATIEDPNLPGVLVWITSKTAGVGFNLTYSAAYPTATGVLHYTVINP